MPDTVTTSFDAIVGWLATHAPAAAAGLAPPAADTVIADAETVLGRVLPDDLRAWWRHADGVVTPQAGEPLPLIPWDLAPLPVAAALRVRQSRLRIERDIWSARLDVDRHLTEAAQAPAGTASQLWLPDWLPIARDAGTETLLVDLRAGERYGTVMVFDRVDGATGPPRWNGVADMLEEIAWRLTDADPALPGDPWIDAILGWPTAPG